MHFPEVDVIRKLCSAEAFIDRLGLKDPRILNAGSSSVRFGQNCVNVDIAQKPGVDVVADIHELPDLGEFDIVIAEAVLQYCQDPEAVAEQFYNALRPGGFLYVDAPWVQPYCPDSPDLKRFSCDELQRIFSGFEIISIGPSIGSGSAWSYLTYCIAARWTGNRYVNFASRTIVSWLVWPVSFLSFRNSDAAGAYYVEARKPIIDGEQDSVTRGRCRREDDARTAVGSSSTVSGHSLVDRPLSSW